MKIWMTVKNVDTGKIWVEDYEIGDEFNPHEWAEKTIQFFNGTLRSHESERELIQVLDAKGNKL